MARRQVRPSLSVSRALILSWCLGSACSAPAGGADEGWAVARVLASGSLPFVEASPDATRLAWIDCTKENGTPLRSGCEVRVFDSRSGVTTSLLSAAVVSVTGNPWSPNSEALLLRADGNQVLVSMDGARIDVPQGSRCAFHESPAGTEPSLACLTSEGQLLVHRVGRGWTAISLGAGDFQWSGSGLAILVTNRGRTMFGIVRTQEPGPVMHVPLATPAGAWAMDSSGSSIAWAEVGGPLWAWWPSGQRVRLGAQVSNFRWARAERVLAWIDRAAGNTLKMAGPSVAPFELAKGVSEFQVSDGGSAVAWMDQGQARHLRLALQREGWKPRHIESEVTQFQFQPGKDRVFYLRDTAPANRAGSRTLMTYYVAERGSVSNEKIGGLVRSYRSERGTGALVLETGEKATPVMLSLQHPYYNMTVRGAQVTGYGALRGAGIYLYFSTDGAGGQTLQVKQVVPDEL